MSFAKQLNHKWKQQVVFFIVYIIKLSKTIKLLQQIESLRCYGLTGWIITAFIRFSIAFDISVKINYKQFE